MHAAKEGLQRELVEAHTEKQAVMQAGEVLLAELEQLHSARDDAVRKLTGIASGWNTSLSATATCGQTTSAEKGKAAALRAR